MLRHRQGEEVLAQGADALVPGPIQQAIRRLQEHLGLAQHVRPGRERLPEQERSFQSADVAFGHVLGDAEVAADGRVVDAVDRRAADEGERALDVLQVADGQARLIRREVAADHRLDDVAEQVLRRPRFQHERIQAAGQVLVEPGRRPQDCGRHLILQHRAEAEFRQGQFGREQEELPEREGQQPQHAHAPGEVRHRSVQRHRHGAGAPDPGRQEVEDLLEVGRVVTHMVSLVDEERPHAVPVPEDTHEVGESVTAVEGVGRHVKGVFRLRAQLPQHDRLAGAARADEGDERPAGQALQLRKEKARAREPADALHRAGVSIQDLIYVH